MLEKGSVPLIGVLLSQRSRYGAYDVDTRMSTSVNKVEILSETKVRFIAVQLQLLLSM